ncbi:hypothetical protein NHX12_003887 [Muraenolepis orangiensis]|uniref:Contactin associated protein like 2b n=1 Tax=Muraenolepis orangiensis TaxID=630683 RepID=A0A9Q0IDP4_9TELE|nr:hypothetical protein NHX12_003887 [Muraenolepis orangiensis]
MSLFMVLMILSSSGVDVAATASRKCEDSLATPLPYSSFTGSSVYTTGYGAGYAKLNRRGGSGGWSPVVADYYQWLQVDLGSRKQVVAVATQGRYSSSDWTSRYRLLYSDTAKNWRPYLQDSNIWTFPGNSDSEGVVRHELQRPIVARYVRFIPLGWSKEGRLGLRVEVYGCSYWADVISFDGQGVISYRFRSKKIKFIKDIISLKFRTSAGNGVLLHGEGQQGDYISLELQRARLMLSINLGSNQYGSIQGHTAVSSGSLLDDDHWHSVVIQRYRRNVNLTLDHHTQQFRTNGEFDHLDLDSEISFGGVPLSSRPSSGGRDNFVGCMEGIVYNTDNITSLIHKKKVDTSSFVRTAACCIWELYFPLRALTSPSEPSLPPQSPHFPLRALLPPQSPHFPLRALTSPSEPSLTSQSPHFPLRALTYLSEPSLPPQSPHFPLRALTYLSEPSLPPQSPHFPLSNLTSPSRNLTFSCAESRSFPVFFNSSSFVQLPGQGDSDTLSVSLSFRTWNPSGLLVYTALADGVVEVGLADGKVTVYINVTQRKNTRIDISSGSNLNDGQWHSVHLNALENYAMLTIDGDEASTVRTAIPIQITTGGTYYFGGYFLRTNTPPLQRSFQGCMQLIHVDDQLADLRAVEQGLIGTFENVSLDMCAIIDRCVPNQCEHGGRCSQTWDTFSCNCNNTGYAGATCHTSVYPQSCEEYIHLAKAPGSYWVDPDGSGPLKPLRVGCDLTGGTVWTTVKNNLTPQTSVSGADHDGKAVLRLDYNMTTEQVYAVTSGADHCEQHITYTCRMSRLLNTPDGEPYTWWIGRANEAHYYWGGSGPGIQKCACGIERNCTSAKHHCNCDADQRQWREDAGLLVYKDHLPVSQVLVGDTGRTGSEAKITGETSADVSFYFKTSSTYGVFLENLGTTDFIRIELRATSVVSFSFDVGNGAVELSVRSPVRLDDGRWHRVEAERNVKEAVLRLDGRYRDSRPAPPQGHTRLELFSQLYIGASGGQRGFLGCIRALRLNGVTLDLEERARVTPGVNPGCQGHCDHFGQHCHNGGKCVEQYNKYSCDCSHTAYDGPFCLNDVGGYFESGALVRYDFLSEAGLPAAMESRSPQGAALLGETNLTQEELVFSFSTSNTPGILVYVSSKTQDYMAVVLRNNGTSAASACSWTTTLCPATSCQTPQTPKTGQIDPILIASYNTPGFVGCLSRVQFNGVAPLKAALRSSAVAAPVTTHGILVSSNCGAQPHIIAPLDAASDPWKMDTAGAVFPYNEDMISRERLDRNSALIGGVVAVVVCVALSILVFLVRHMFRHKGSYHTNEAKGAESADCADAAIIVNDPAFTETIEESKKEWFI